MFAWYGEGPFSYYFEGETKVILADTPLSDILDADYVVLYIHQWQRQSPSKEVLDYFARMTPVFVARIGNLDYAQVYDVRARNTAAISDQPPTGSRRRITHGMPIERMYEV